MDWPRLILAHLINRVRDNAQHIVHHMDNPVLDRDVGHQDLGPNCAPPELAISLNANNMDTDNPFGHSD